MLAFLKTKFFKFLKFLGILIHMYVYGKEKFENTSIGGEKIDTKSNSISKYAGNEESEFGQRE